MCFNIFGSGGYITRIRRILAGFFWYRWYYPHWSREALPPVCWIFFILKFVVFFWIKVRIEDKFFSRTSSLNIFPSNTSFLTGVSKSLRSAKTFQNCCCTARRRKEKRVLLLYRIKGLGLIYAIHLLPDQGFSGMFLKHCCVMTIFSNI